jgi:hypothetical protein
MLESEQYRQYARDCVRIAAGMRGKDRKTLLDIAAAWEARATEVETQATKK